MAKSDNLRKAKSAKYDEFYTRLEDIEAEISQHPDYVRQFHGKTVFCNCDDPEWSNFFVFFKLHFNQLKLKKLITTHYNPDGESSYKIEWEGEMLNGDMVNLIKTPLNGNGDFRSDECIEILKESDIIVTNPPFSLFYEYIRLLFNYQKKFVIIGNRTSFGNKETFQRICNQEMWIGYSSTHHMLFYVPDEYGEKLKSDPNRKEGHGQSYCIKDGKVLAEVNACWYTNLDIDRRHEPLILNANYKGNERRYPKYDGTNVIECKPVKLIPKDYFDVMGVPITFLEKYCPEQFEILGKTSARINGVNKFSRILIQRKTATEE